MLPEIRLTTERLTLRTPIEDDFPAVAAFMASPRARFVGGPVEDAFARWRGFLGSAGHWALKGYGMFVVLLGDRPIGRVGVIDHLGWEEPELGWQLFDGFEGHGYAQEAATAARRWAFAARGLGPLISYIAPENVRSRAVAVRLDARHERDGTLLDFPVEIWRHPDPRETRR
jgi:RimJ/RimL family protein N-acetyltransferase